MFSWLEFLLAIIFAWMKLVIPPSVCSWFSTSNHNNHNFNCPSLPTKIPISGEESGHWTGPAAIARLQTGSRALQENEEEINKWWSENKERGKERSRVLRREDNFNNAGLRNKEEVKAKQNNQRRKYDTLNLQDLSSTKQHIYYH